MNLIDIGNMTEIEAKAYLEKIVWGEKPVCPFCGHTHSYSLNGKTTRNGLYECASCGKPFTVTVNTIIHGSHLPIKVWLLAFYLVCSSKKGISALQLQRQLGIGSYRTAWSLNHRIRKAMEESPDFCKLFGYVEADETYVGGKGKGGKRGRGSQTKTPVIGLVQRNGRAKVKPVKHVDSKTLKEFIVDNVDTFSKILTDEWPAYNGIGKYFDFGHDVVNHKSGEYVRGDISTNWIESFWSLLKKGIGGVFHHVSVKYLGLYCDEFCYRWNTRKDSDGERFNQALKGIVGKRVQHSMLVA